MAASHSLVVLLMDDLQTFFSMVLQRLASGDPLIVGVIVALLVILLTTAVLFIRSQRRNLRRAVLLVGLSDSGKTLLFSKLVASKNVSTYTSMKENSAHISLPNKRPLRLVDVPGNERLRNKYIDDYKSLTRGIIFVIDSLNFPREVRDVAEFLYTILSDRVISQNRPPVLIACNKQDETMAKSPKVVQSQLEKEINTLRITQTAALDSTGDTGNISTFVGRRGKDFQFSDLKPMCIDILECSAKSEDEESPAISLVKEWLMKIA